MAKKSAAAPAAAKSEPVWPLTADSLARLFHDIYTELAPRFGWKPQEGTDGSFEALPEANRALAVATAEAILTKLHLIAVPAADPETEADEGSPTLATIDAPDGSGVLAFIRFHSGVARGGPGVRPDDIIQLLIRRLAGYQTTAAHSPDFEQAISHLRSAQRCLEKHAQTAAKAATKETP